MKIPFSKLAKPTEFSVELDNPLNASMEISLLSNFLSCEEMKEIVINLGLSNQQLMFDEEDSDEEDFPNRLSFFPNKPKITDFENFEDLKGLEYFIDENIKILRSYKHVLNLLKQLPPLIKEVLITFRGN
jgi:hypothetical protein